MISQAPDVPTYIAEAPAERRAALEKLRALRRKSFPGADETIQHGMPVYKRGDAILVAFASQKQFVALYVGQQTVEAFKDELSGAKCGKGCIRFPKPETIDFTVIRRLLAANATAKAAAR